MNMDETTKYHLISQFREFLESDTADSLDSLQSTDQEKPIDLLSLFSELAGLRNEVKLEARQVKSALEDFKSALALAESNQEKLNTELDRYRQEAKRYRQQSDSEYRDAQRKPILDILEFRDRLQASLNSLQNFRPSTTQGWFGRCRCQSEKDFLNSFHEGQNMLLRRVDQALARYQVKPLETIGKSLDPHTMSAVETENRPDLDNGIVTEELRTGFFWNEEILRLAEVKVNKKT